MAKVFESETWLIYASQWYSFDFRYLIWRMHRYCGSEDRLATYHKFLAALVALLALSCGVVASRADAYSEEIVLFKRVRDHFLMENGMTWSPGLEYPDGFQPYPKRWFFF